MKVHVKLDEALRFVATNERGHTTTFDTGEKSGGLNSAASPVEILLEAAAACSAMDIVSILRKQRRTIEDFRVEVAAERADTHPKVFTKAEVIFSLVSPDATLRELVAAIELSHEKYCTVSIMMARSGCEISWRALLVSFAGEILEQSESDDSPKFTTAH